MRRRFHHRLIAGIAALALVFAMLGYAAHYHDAAGGPHNDAHCDLCLQLHAAAGPPSLLQNAGPAASGVYLLPVTSDGFNGRNCLVRVQQPRAPPGTLHG